MSAGREYVRANQRRVQESARVRVRAHPRVHCFLHTISLTESMMPPPRSARLEGVDARRSDGIAAGPTAACAEAIAKSETAHTRIMMASVVLKSPPS